MRTNTVVIGLGCIPSPALKPKILNRTSRAATITFGAVTSAPFIPPFTDPLPNTTLSTATAKARVTMARLTPRTRRAGRATTTPTSAATNPPKRIGRGNGMWGTMASWASENGSGTLSGPSLVTFDTRYAEMPAKAIWASEICPT